MPKKKKLKERKYNLSCPQVGMNHDFFWRTKLSLERMRQISDWIGSLTDEQKKMLEDLKTDIIDNEEFNNADIV